MRDRCRHDRVQVVASQPLFESLSEAECIALVDRSVCRSVQRGETLFREGDPCRGLYLVVEGTVRTYRSNRNGQEQVFRVFVAGDSVGQVSLFDEGPYLASARVAETGRLLFLPWAEVRALYRTHPQVAHAVVKELASRVRSLTALVDQLALQDVPTRVARAVQRYAEENGAVEPGTTFRLPRTQEELAAELGTSREGVSRALRRLRVAGVIGQNGRKIELIDPGKLGRIAGRGGVATGRVAITASVEAHARSCARCSA